MTCLTVPSIKARSILGFWPQSDQNIKLVLGKNTLWLGSWPCCHNINGAELLNNTTKITMQYESNINIKLFPSNFPLTGYEDLKPIHGDWLHFCWGGLSESVHLMWRPQCSPWPSQSSKGYDPPSPRLCSQVPSGQWRRPTMTQINCHYNNDRFDLMSSF